MIRSRPFLSSCRSGETGRRAGLKIPCPQGRVGSIPTSGTSLSLVGIIQVQVRTLTFLFLLGAAVVAGRAATAEAQAQAWTTYGKICPGSEIQDILVRSEDELWFACRLGGVKKSLDGGRTAVDVSGGVKDTDVIRLADTPLGLVAGALNGRTGRQGVYLLPPGATKWNRARSTDRKRRRR